MLNLSDELSWEGQTFIRLTKKEVTKEDGHYQLPVPFRKEITQRVHQVESTSIGRGHYVDTSKTKFR